MAAPKFNLDMGKMSDPAFRDAMFSQVNGMVKLATDKLMCDPACQYQRKSEELKRKLDKAATVKTNIPSIYKRREKDYYVFTKGVPYYDNMMEDRYEATARQLVQKMFKKHREQMRVLREELQSYASGTLYEQNIRDLWVKYQKEEKMYRLATLNMENNIAISDRQSSYEDAETVKIKQTRNIVMFIYYSIVFMFLVYLVAKKRYMEIKLWVVFVFLLIYPVLKTYALKQGTSIKDKVKAYFNNVYLDEDTCDDCDEHKPAIAT